MEGHMEYRIVVQTDEHGRPRIVESSGPLPDNATFTITGSEEEGEAPWVRLGLYNFVVIDTGVVTGVRLGAQQSESLARTRA
jgi:hypothetical protein